MATGDNWGDAIFVDGLGDTDAATQGQRSFIPAVFGKENRGLRRPQIPRETRTGPMLRDVTAKHVDASRCPAFTGYYEPVPPVMRYVSHYGPYVPFNPNIRRAPRAPVRLMHPFGV